LRGVVRKTWLRGECVFDAGSKDLFGVTPRGREYAVSCDLR